MSGCSLFDGVHPRHDDVQLARGEELQQFEPGRIADVHAGVRTRSTAEHLHAELEPALERGDRGDA